MTHRIYIRAKHYHKSSIKYRTTDYDTWQKWYYTPDDGLNKIYYFNDDHYSFHTIMTLCNATFISIQDKYMDYDPFRFYRHQDCQLKRNLSDQFDCFFISTSRAISYYYFKTKKTLALAWIEADNTCKSIGGYLPIFHSRKDLNDLLYAARFLPVNNTFIGLRYNKVSEELHSELSEQVREFASVSLCM